METAELGRQVLGGGRNRGTPSAGSKFPPTNWKWRIKSSSSTKLSSNRQHSSNTSPNRAVPTEAGASLVRVLARQSKRPGCQSNKKRAEFRRLCRRSQLFTWRRLIATSGPELEPLRQTTRRSRPCLRMATSSDRPFCFCPTKRCAHQPSSAVWPQSVPPFVHFNPTQPTLPRPHLVQKKCTQLGICEAALLQPQVQQQSADVQPLLPHLATRQTRLPIAAVPISSDHFQFCLCDFCPVGRRCVLHVCGSSIAARADTVAEKKKILLLYAASGNLFSNACLPDVVSASKSVPPASEETPDDRLRLHYAPANPPLVSRHAQADNDIQVYHLWKYSGTDGGGLARLVSCKLVQKVQEHVCLFAKFWLYAKEGKLLLICNATVR
ncbi:unnamed protein product [Protopolystoma xenopodis]|uniref:Uncharacterized protein n=1 Tax=Protopolystoma xenopodis TaxID=117903 RepID=A0A3S5CCW2_9PLAT|nr:unnamed protein product [Protopolystoma xenopodis]